MKDIIAKLPKTTIATIAGAILVYCLGKGYIDADTANLISAILTAFGITVNTISGKLTRK
jgi:hypothetical protein